MLRLLAAPLLLVSLATPALAHTGLHSGFSFTHGFVHPFLGLDHLLVMVAVGLWAATARAERPWVWPLTFMAAMLVGGVLARSGVSAPLTETVVAASVVALGAMLLLSVRMPVLGGAAVLALFGLAHGFAHGAEAPADGFALYAAGFVFGTLILHGIGLGTGMLCRSGRGVLVSRLLGGAVATIGLALIVAGGA